MVKPKRLGHLVLRVRDLGRSEQFYTEVLGLHVSTRISDTMVFLSASETSSHELALISVGQGAPGPEQHRVGLHHFAWEMESLGDLRSLYEELINQNVHVREIGDHGISLGAYLFDPDGNEIEVFYEFPKEQWPEDNIFAGSFPGSLGNRLATTR